MASARKPLRLRSACNECYAAKVRCSGEKYGCERCRRNGLTCEYQVSMVGRASKKRRPDPNDQLDPDQTGTASSGTALPPSGLHSGLSPQPVLDACVLGDFTSVLRSTIDDAPAAPSLDVCDFTPYPTEPSYPAELEVDTYFQALLNEYPDLPLLSSSANTFSTLPETLLSDPQSNIIGISAPGSTETHKKAQTTPDLPTISHDRTSKAPQHNQTPETVRSRLADQTDSRVPSVYRDQSVVSQYPHAAALMKTIEGLEEQLQTSNLPIDHAMQLNRQAMAKVREVGNTDDFRRCQSCPLLVTTMMDLVLGLYELVIVSIQQQDEVSGPPLFQFGCLEFDPDEQEMFRIALVRRDLRRCVETLQYCGQEILPRQRQVANLRGKKGNGVSRSVKSSGAPVHSQWYQEMGYRAKELLATLPAKCSH